MPNFTKIAIQQSFLRLLSQRPITKITVKDIVEDCGINRNSFYYHFQDLPQLLETVIIESADEIISRIPESFSLEEGLTTVLERLVENKRAIRNIWASPDRAFYEQNLMRVCNYVVSRYIACRSVDLLRTLPEEELALLVDFCQCELFGQVTNWLNQNMVYDIVAHVQALCRLFEAVLPKRWRQRLWRRKFLFTNAATFCARWQPGAPTAPRDSNYGAGHGFVGQRILKKALQAVTKMI